MNGKCIVRPTFPTAEYYCYIIHVSFGCFHIVLLIDRAEQLELRL